MPERATNEDVVHQYAERSAANDFDGLGQTPSRRLAGDLAAVGRARPRPASWAEIARNYPGGMPDISLDRLVGSEDRWVVSPGNTVARIAGSGDFWWGEWKMTYPDGRVYECVTLIELREGLIWRETVYWAEPFEAPDWRRPFVERAGQSRDVTMTATLAPIEIGPGATTVDAIVGIADGAPAVLTTEAVARIAASRAVVDDLVSGDDADLRPEHRPRARAQRPDAARDARRATRRRSSSATTERSARRWTRGRPGGDGRPAGGHRPGRQRRQPGDRRDPRRDARAGRAPDRARDRLSWGVGPHAHGRHRTSRAGPRTSGGWRRDPARAARRSRAPGSADHPAAQGRARVHLGERRLDRPGRRWSPIGRRPWRISPTSSSR